AGARRAWSIARHRAAGVRAGSRRRGRYRLCRTLAGGVRPPRGTRRRATGGTHPARLRPAHRRPRRRAGRDGAARRAAAQPAPQRRPVMGGFFDGLIGWSIHNRVVVLLGAVALAIGGVWAAAHASLDVLPDFTPP